jgi:2-deoxy-D-gluconate 3-dehydrogenase
MTAVPGQLDLTGKSAVVTGGGRGLGRATALALAERGADVTVVSRTLTELDAVVAEAAHLQSNVDAVVADLADTQACGDVAAELWDVRGRVDIVVHAAGRQLRKPSIDITADELRSVLDLNLAAPFLLSAAVGRRMIEQQIAGRHIFIGSLASRIGLPQVVPYAASKSGLLGVVHGLANEWAPHAITVNAVLPGYVETALTRDLLSDPERQDWVLSRIPMGRLGAPEDIAGACLYLASDAAGYVTGQCITVDGGWLAS